MPKTKSSEGVFKVPKHIKKTLHRIAFLNAQAALYMEGIEDWLRFHGFNPDTEGGNSLRNGSGYGLEEFDYGNDITEEFCAELEEMKNGRKI